VIGESSSVKGCFHYRRTGRRPLLIGVLGVALATQVLPGQSADAPPAIPALTNALAFRPSADGGFEFDTGLLRGRLRAGGKSLGLTEVTQAATGLRVDRSNGLLSHYRVFTRGKRHGGGAWDWPSTARSLPNGGVAVRWPAAEGRPFGLVAVYLWRRPDILDLTTSVEANEDVAGFESFLASYFSEGFTNSLVHVQGDADHAGQPYFRAALKSDGDWQMFTRDEAARVLAQDGRWKLEPNPVDWVLRPVLARPLGLRRAPATGLAFAVMAFPEDCFAIATPQENEGHRSLYLSLFGRDLAKGQTLRARTRLVMLSSEAEHRAVPALERFLSRRGSE
jgi:hypothetical protein